MSQYNGFLYREKYAYVFYSGIKSYTVCKDGDRILIYNDEKPKELIWELAYKEDGYWSSRNGIDVLILGKYDDMDKKYNYVFPLLDERVHIKKISDDTYISYFYPTCQDDQKPYYAFIYDSNYKIKKIYALNFFDYK